MQNHMQTHRCPCARLPTHSSEPARSLARACLQKLEVVSDEELEAALLEVLPQGTSLMTDVFGNYVMQKFLEHGNQECREKVAGVLKGQVGGMLECSTWCTAVHCGACAPGARANRRVVAALPVCQMHAVVGLKGRGSTGLACNLLSAVLVAWV